MTHKTTYYIYRHTNNLNGKTYIGCSTNPLKRWRHGRGYSTNKEFYRDITLYGWENFSHVILLQTENLQLASELETILINLYHSQYNNHHNSNTGRKPLNTAHSKPVLQYTSDGLTLLNTFPSAAEAERQTGINFANISACCYGRRKTAGGFKWTFKENNND